MDASLIALIYSVLISLFIIFGIFWGLIRGFKKTLFRGIFLVVSAVLVFGITRLVSSAFANMDITWMNINVNGVVPSNIEELISESLKASLEEEIALGLIDSIDVILSFVELFVSVILFWLLFILFKYLLLPLNYLLYKLIFRSAEEKEYARLKKMNKKMHGKVNAFVNGNDEFKITPINQYGDKEDKSSNVQTKKGSSKKVSKERKYSNGFKIQNKNEFVPLNEYVPNFDAEQESVDNQVAIQKPKKRRLVGALMGIPVGLFCGAMMLMPLNGFMNLAQEVNKQKAVAMQSEEGYVQAITNGAYEDIEKGYNNSLGNYVMTYTGAKFVSTLTFNTITTRKINGTKVKLKDDLVKTIETVNDVYEITQIDFNNVTQEEMDKNLTKIDEVVEKVLNIGIVKALLKTGVAIGSDYIINSEMDLGEFDSIVKASLDALKNIDSNAISNELRGAVNVAKTLNAKLEETSESLLTMIIKGDKIDVDVLSKITDDNIDSVIDSLFDFENYRMTTTSSIIPELVELGFNAGEGLINEFMANETNKFVYSDNAETIENLGSKDELVESIKNVLKGALKVVKYSQDSIGNAIINVGLVLDELENNTIISSDSFDSLIKSVEEYANKVAKEALKDVISEKEINELTDSLSDITNWGTECEHLGKAYTIYEENNTEDSPMFPKDSNDKLDIKNIKFNKLGAILDEISKTQILSKAKINGLLADVIENQFIQVEGSENYKINGVELELSGDFKNQLIANIDRLTSYENELALIQSILIGDEPILDIDQLKEDVFANLGMLGGALDQLTNGTSSLNKSELFTDELIVSVFSDLLEGYKKTEEKLSDLDKALNGLIENVISENGTLKNAVKEEDFSWKTECEYLSEAYNIFKENNTGASPMFPINAKDELDIKNIKFDKLSEILDEILKTKLLSIDIVNGLLSDFVENQFIQVEGTDNYKINGVELEFSEASKNEFLNNVKSLSSYKNELALIQSVLIGDEPILDLDQLKEDVFANLGMLGGALDQLTKGTQTLENSKLFTNDLVVLVFSDLLEGYKKTGEELSSMDNAFNELIDDVIGENGTLIEAVEKDGFSWENEFNKISTIKDLELDNLSNIGSALDSVVGGENPSLLITNKELVKMVKMVVEGYKDSSIDASIETQAVNSVIDEIIKNNGALDNAIKKKEFSWKVELEKLETLSNLDLTKTYSEIGEDLDNAIDGSMILSDSLVVVMFNKIVESYKFTENVLTVTEEAINKLLDGVETNLNQIVLNNGDNICWENELSYLSELKSLKGQENIFESGTAIENASKSSSIITDKLIADMLITIINGYEKKDESLTDNQTAINTLLERIGENLTNKKIDFNWEKEINHVKNLEDKLESLTSINSESINSLSSIGDVLDNIAFNYDDESKNSDIITKSAIVDLMQSMIDSLKYTNLQSSDENYVKKLLINNFLAGDIDGDATNNSTNSTVGISLAGLDKDFNWETAKNETIGAGFKWTNEFKCLNYVVDEINKSTSSDLATLINVATNAILEVEMKCNIIIYNV